MRPTPLLPLLPLLLLLPGGSAGAAQEAPAFLPSSFCANCHAHQVEQHFKSHHERSFSSPVFQAQYFRLVLPRAAKEPGIAADAARCTACHSPVAYAIDRKLARSAAVGDPSLAGVTCDFCHSMVGFDGRTPQDGNYVVEPGPIKLGPFRRSSANHSGYNELQTRSELCATCHEAVNSHGVRIKSTYTEWTRSDFAKKGIQCQDCHMSRDGVFVDGGRYESGSAASTPLAHVPSRERIYSHHFPGIHSGAAVEGAVGLKVLDAPARSPAGRPLTILLAVDNSNTGHCLPTGSADLRLLWLEVVARIGSRAITLPADNRAKGTWAAVGENSDDALVLGGDVPVGSRLYRAVNFDRTNHQTLASFDATSVAFDNRLLPGEKRRESYTFDVPRDATGLVKIEARLRYRAYPSSLAKALDVVPPDVVEVARASAEVAIDPAPDEAAPPPPERLTPLERLRRLKQQRGDRQ